MIGSGKFFGRWEQHANSTRLFSFLHTKGFKLSEDAQGFIMFGQGYTGASDGLVNAAIEATIKHQLQFDGSYFIALLERLKEEKITDKKSAKAFMRTLQA